MSNKDSITFDDIEIDLGDYGAQASTMIDTLDTITLTGSSDQYSSINTITLPSSTFTYGGATVGGITTIGNINSNTGWTTGTSGQYYTSTGTGVNWNNPPTVNISNTGIDMAAGTDITVAGKSLKQFMDNMEERLAILHPNPALEDRWEQLKELRKQYVEMEKDLLEKEKLMKILKES
jgi:hypothetical protein